ncbi:MAG: LexA family protein [Thermomonas sp.]
MSASPFEAETRALFLGPVSQLAAPRPVPLAGIRARAGFPSPAEDFQEDSIDLGELLIRNPAATYLYRAEGWSMLHAGICDQDILVVDWSVEVMDGDIVVATYDGNQPTCKVLRFMRDGIELHSRNPHSPNIVIPPESAFEAFAVVGVVRQIRRNHGRVRAR